ncbi:hypothetical protein BKA60DRAFT_661006 [Fusarium oxysporum]|nr:hypothetical protein BKA60DRAFT_661006 [Fusarium oxysporum]
MVQTRQRTTRDSASRALTEPSQSTLSSPLPLEGTAPRIELAAATPTRATPEADETTELIRITQIRIAQLEELQELQRREEELLGKLRPLIPPATGTRPRRDSTESHSSSGREVRVRNITKLTLPTTFQKRDAWLSDLYRAFTGARRRYRKDYKKILTALDNMDGEGRGRWDRYVDELPEDIREITERSWEAFKEWSLSLIKDAANREPLLMKQLEAARQRDTQTPQEFHQYLDSIEKHFPRALERQRALSFYAKLLPSLQDHITLHSPKIPETREDIVTLATRFWDSMRAKSKRPAEAAPSNRPWKSQRRIDYEKEPWLLSQGYRGNGPRQNHDSRPDYNRSQPQGYRPSQSGSNSKRNPIDPKTGKPFTCHNCDSETHFASHCDKPKDPKIGAYQGKGQRGRR